MLAGMLGWHVLIVLAVALIFAAIVAGGVIVIVALSRRRRETGALAVAGWYPDPSGRDAQRYWDGTRWTGHTDAAPPQPDVRGG
ncbi:scramblase [Microbacterium sp. HM58-2]|nr:scramblase [Microbacterium sp. HM58-2]